MNELLTEILKIPGEKILRLVGAGENFVVDVDQSGKFGYQRGVKELFLAKLYAISLVGGCLIIREFLPISQKRRATNGKMMWMPEKNLYGVVLRDGQWFGLSKEELKMMYEVDANTGESLPQEEGVHYQNFGPSFS